jgi:hypothetical protein
VSYPKPDDMWHLHQGGSYEDIQVEDEDGRNGASPQRLIELHNGLIEMYNQKCEELEDLESRVNVIRFALK